MSWQNQLKGDSLSWLLEPETPGVRYLALRDLLDLPPDDPDLAEAKKLAHTRGLIAGILDEMNEEGYWAKSGPGYNPKYRSTDWSTNMLALAWLPPEKRTPIIERAIETGVNFLFSTDPVEANYPTANGEKPSSSWWKFGFPGFYISDMLQIVEVLVKLGYGRDPRLANSLQYIREKQDANGRWLLEYSYQDKIWVAVGEKKKPNKWVTLRALRVLKAVG